MAVAPFPWRRNAQGFRPMDMRKIGRSKTRVTSRFLFGKGFQNFFRSDGNLINPHTDGVVDGVGDCGHDREKRTLTDFFRSIRAARFRSSDNSVKTSGNTKGGGAL